MYDLCVIGHITLDKVVTAHSLKYMPGGTAYYCSKALQHFDLNYLLVTALAKSEEYITNDLSEAGINAISLASDHTVYFENIYSKDLDYREQNVLQKATAFSVSAMPEINANIFHLGPLLADDIPVSLIKELSAKSIISLDVQGYLRTVNDKKINHTNWPEMKEALPYITILKANESEMEVISGTTNTHEAAKYIASLGVKEVVITLGSKGSLVYAENIFYKIPAFKASAIVDATGCGDTYMAGYLFKKIKGADIQEAGEFGAAMAALKIASSGPFNGDKSSVDDVLQRYAVTL